MLDAGDFPDVNRYREIMSGYDISTFPKLREKDVKALEDTLSIDIPTLVKQVQLHHTLLERCMSSQHSDHAPNIQ